jgi:calcium binding protein 39
MALLRKLSTAIPALANTQLMKKSPTQLVTSSVEALKTIQAKCAYSSTDNDETSFKQDYEKAVEELTKNLSLLKSILYGDLHGESNQEPKRNEILDVALHSYSSHFLLLLVQYVEHLEFEARKDAMQIFNNLLKLQMNSRYPTVEYIAASPQILLILMNGYEKPEVAVLTGSMLRECIKYEVLAKNLFDSVDPICKLFRYMAIGVFEVESDAFLTFRELILSQRHRSMASEFMINNYEVFFTHFDKLMSGNYVTKIQSIKILGEILTDRSNFQVMRQYISNRENIKLLMTLLLDKSKLIQIEAFHVFKIFVANPHKTDDILEILYMNKSKLIRYLEMFNNPDVLDEVFKEDKETLIEEIRKLERPASMGTEPSTPSSPSSPSMRTEPSESTEQQQESTDNVTEDNE